MSEKKDLQEQINAEDLKEALAQKQQKAEKKEKKADKKKAEPTVLPLDQQADFFNKNIELTVAKIIDVKPNPEGEKLYIETLDDGSGTQSDH